MTTSSVKRPPSFEQYASTRLFQPALAFSPDGQTLAYSINTSGQFNLWTQPVEERGAPRQLTFFTDQTVRNIIWSPDGAKIYFQADQNGDEFFQLYVIEANGGEPQALTHTMDAQHHLGYVSPDNSRLSFSSNSRVRTELDSCVLDLNTGEVTLLSTGRDFYTGYWSPEGEYIQAMHLISNTNTNLYLIKPGTEPELLSPHEEDAVFWPSSWAADGSGFYFVTDNDREFKGLAFYDLADRRWHWVEEPEWDVEEATLSDNGQKLAWTVNEDGYSVLYVRDKTSGALVTLPAFPKGVITRLTISGDGQKLAFFLSRPTQPAELFMLDIEQGTATQLTNNFYGELDKASLVEPEVIRYQSFDGREIPAFLFKPRNLNGKVPVVLYIHGGPEAQERPTYRHNGLFQYWLSRGIGVLATNIRGSTGYGKSYQKLIHRDWGGNDLKDWQAAADYLKSLDWVDGTRLGVVGGSYGGFATLSCVTRLPDYWAAAVDIVGPSNLITFVQAVPPFWRKLMKQLVGDGEDDREMLIERSPITYVEQLKCPILIIQGGKDPRVVKGESDQMVARLRELGRTVRYEVYEDEGHGFTRRENDLKVGRAMAEWIEQYLLSPAATTI